jgi:large subunit ribosomal protein L35
MKNKIKTHRGAAKRFKVTGSGKVRRKQAGTQHLLVHKSAKRRRNLRGSVAVDKGEVRTIKRLIPYGN